MTNSIDEAMLEAVTDRVLEAVENRMIDEIVGERYGKTKKTKWLEQPIEDRRRIIAAIERIGYRPNKFEDDRFINYYLYPSDVNEDRVATIDEVQAYIDDVREWYQAHG